MTVGLISDTHGQLRSQVFDAFSGVELILHAGDIGDLNIITDLEAIAPVHAVHGNTDDFEVRAKYGESISLELAGKRITVVHGHTFGAPTPERLRAAFTNVDAIVYGHTHMPLIDRADGVALVINPGAAGPRRFKLEPSVALLELPQLAVQIVSL